MRKITLLFGIVVLLWTISSASPLKRLRNQVKRIAPNDEPHWTYLTKRNIPNSEIHAIRTHLSRRKREYNSDENENYPPVKTFYSYKNIGSLYVDADDTHIKHSMYNFGVEGHPGPKSGPPGVISYEDE